MEGALVVASEDEAVKEVRMGHVDTWKQSFPGRGHCDKCPETET